jgi:hypothetical protein
MAACARVGHFIPPAMVTHLVLIRDRSDLPKGSMEAVFEGPSGFTGILGGAKTSPRLSH